MYLAACFTANYLQGVLALSRALQSNNSAHDLVVMCFNDPNIIDPLVKYNIRYRIVDPVVVPNYISDLNNSSNHANWSNTFSKLRMFGLDEFSKIVYLDSDLLIVKNIDLLFDYPHMSAVSAGLMYGKNMGVPFNAGLMVLEPNKDLEAELLFTLERLSFCRSEPFSDNDVLCTLYPNWDTTIELHMDDRYNVIYDTIHNYVEDHILDMDDFAVIHFAGASKPWMDNYVNPCDDEYSCYFLNMYLSYFD